MPLPPFTESGDLPPGVHRATLPEALQRFGTGSPQRKVMALRLERIYRLARATGHLGRVVVFGSLVTANPEPLMWPSSPVGRGCSSITPPPKRISGRACSGCAGWPLSGANRRPSSTGRSNAMAVSEALSRFSRRHHDCQ